MHFSNYGCAHFKWLVQLDPDSGRCIKKRLKHRHTHTRVCAYIYTYICIYMCVCVCVNCIEISLEIGKKSVLSTTKICRLLLHLLLLSYHLAHLLFTSSLPQTILVLYQTPVLIVIWLGICECHAGDQCVVCATSSINVRFLKINK